jgi:hypothetical protein
LHSTILFWLSPDGVVLIINSTFLVLSLSFVWCGEIGKKFVLVKGYNKSYLYILQWVRFKLVTLAVIGIVSCKSNYYTIRTTTVLTTGIEVCVHEISVMATILLYMELHFPVNQCLSPIKLWVLKFQPAIRYTWKNQLWLCLSVTCSRLVVSSMYLFSPPIKLTPGALDNCNIAESGIKHI